MRYPLAEAAAQLGEGIKAHNAAHEIPEAIDRGYHETTTQAWLRLVHAMLSQYGPANSADEFADQHPELLEKKTLRLFYSRHRFLSARAKAEFIEPDLTPLPSGRIVSESAPAGVEAAAPTIRPAAPADIEEMVRVHFAAVHGSCGEIYPMGVQWSWSPPPDDPRRIGAMQRMLPEGEELFVVAQCAGRIRGFGSVAPAAREIRAVYVEPSVGRRGIGGAILRRLEQIAQAHGAAELHLHSSLNAAAFYEKYGYRAAGPGVHRLQSNLQMSCILMHRQLPGA